MGHLNLTIRVLGTAVLVLAPLFACATARGQDPQQERPPPVAKEPGRFPDKAEMEDIFARQPALMSKALSAVADSRPGVAEFFFVGFAGQASEDVFLNETQAAERLFRRRFGAAGRTLVLANNSKSARELPLASVEGLETVLREIARKMGREDVLFLYVASHGRPGRISVRYGRADLTDLRARTLRRMLDGAGIRNRVLVISACYSGSFIEPMHDQNTLIMTAAAADRTSFGCGHDGVFTYFGRALIGEALEKERSFARAFESAAKSIAEREEKEGLKHSNPQISVGEAITPVLQNIERSLNSHP